MALVKVMEDFKSSLSDLTSSSNSLINKLTTLAEESNQFAESIVEVIENHILNVAPASKKLPCLYLIDSMMKNIRKGSYLKLFMPNIANVFSTVFVQGDKNTRRSMFTLRKTWSNMLNKHQLDALDVRVNQIDRGWPIRAKPTAKAAVNSNPTDLSCSLNRNRVMSHSE
jgi:hypothetical protein